MPDHLPQVLPQLAVVREAECIGCTKCIQACPVDAIIGAAKQMHTVMSDECIGCGLCLPPCPVDCIDLVSITALSPAEQQQKIDHANARFKARHFRMATNKQEKKSQMAKIPASENIKIVAAISPDDIKAAIARVIAKRTKK